MTHIYFQGMNLSVSERILYKWSLQVLLQGKWILKCETKLGPNEERMLRGGSLEKKTRIARVNPRSESWRRPIHQMTLGESYKRPTSDDKWILKEAISDKKWILKEVYPSDDTRRILKETYIRWSLSRPTSDEKLILKEAYPSDDNWILKET